MKICNNCKRIQPDSATICSNCGRTSFRNTLIDIDYLDEDIIAKRKSKRKKKLIIALLVLFFILLIIIAITVIKVKQDANNNLNSYSKLQNQNATVYSINI